MEILHFSPILKTPSEKKLYRTSKTSLSLRPPNFMCLGIIFLDILNPEHGFPGETVQWKSLETYQNQHGDTETKMKPSRRRKYVWWLYTSYWVLNTQTLSHVIKCNLHGNIAANPIQPICFPGCCRLLLCVLCFSSVRPCSPSPYWTGGRTSCHRSLVNLFLITDAYLF